MVQTPSTEALAAARGRTPLGLQGLAFVFGFFLEFNIFVGGGGDGAAATGGFGYRISDILCVIAVALLMIQALSPRRLVPLAIFSLVIAVIAGMRVLEPTFGEDTRTVILALHYLASSFAGLYVAMILSDETVRDRYCWGLIFGLLATVPIFILQSAGYASVLIDLGLLPGFYQVLRLDIGDTLRYAGLWGHPNEAAHIAALAAPAGAYFFIVRRQMLPLALVAGALVAVFYYTQSRGGFLVGSAILAISFLIGRQRRIDLMRLALCGAGIAALAVFVSQLGFISSRFQDVETGSNFAERLSSIWFGLALAFDHPFGMSAIDFLWLMSSGTGGVTSPHNGFIFFAIVFGWLPTIIVIAAIVRNLHIRSNADVLFALTTLGVIFSNMFEEMPGSYSFAFVICLIVGRAFVSSGVGRGLAYESGVHNRKAPSGSGRSIGSVYPLFGKG
jgi:hypothetical protein